MIKDEPRLKCNDPSSVNVAVSAANSNKQEKRWLKQEQAKYVKLYTIFNTRTN